MSNNNYISIKEFRKNPEKFSSIQIAFMCGHQKLSKKFMRDMAKYLNWENICSFQDLSEDFIDEMADYVKWNYIWHYQKLSEQFIEKHLQDREKYNFSWANLQYNWRIYYHKAFIYKHWNELNVLATINYISDCDEELWRVVMNDDRYKDEKFAISTNLYNVSINFLREFEDRIDFNQRIAYYFRLDENFWDEFGYKLTRKNFDYFSQSWKRHRIKTLKKYNDKINWQFIKPEYCGQTKEEIEEVAEMKKYYLKMEKVTF